jgi:hypothetical protein
VNFPYWLIAPLLMQCLVCNVLAPAPVAAQTLTGGWIIQLYGMVQVEPGANVLMLDVQGEEIRFVIHNVRCNDRNFSMARFLSDTTNRVPGLYVKGSDLWLELLRKERPGKRVLKMSGTYYQDSRTLLLSNLEQFHEQSTPQSVPRP